MAGSNIPDIASDPEKGILKVSFFMFQIWWSCWNMIFSPVLTNSVGGIAPGEV